VSKEEFEQEKNKLSSYNYYKSIKEASFKNIKNNAIFRAFT
jgi:hypothetical protein